MLEYIKTLINKQTFALFFSISIVVHLLLIISSSKIKDLILPYTKKPVPVSSNETTIEFVFNENSNSQELVVEKKTLDIIDEIADEELESEKKKRQQFIDSSHLQTDEESQMETDKIGEKASVARDNRANTGDINEESFSEGKSEIASLIKGSYSYEQKTDNVYVPESIPENIKEERKKELKKEDKVVEIEEVKEEDKVEEFEKVKEEIKKDKEVVLEKEIKEELDKEEETEISENNEIIKESDDREIDKNLTDKEDELNQEIEENEFDPKDKVVSVIQYQNEELRDIESRFERIIPFPEEQRELQNEDYKYNKPEAKKADVKKEKKRKDYLLKKKKEKIVREIFEVYEKDINSQKKDEKKGVKPKVSMGVNGKTAYNVPSPSYKADLSNASLVGEPSFNIKKHEYAEYYKHIREKISLYWLLYFGTDQSIKFETKQESPIIIEFKIRPSGRITDVQIAEDAGNPFLASRTQVSVTNTQLDKFPDFIEEEFIDVRFNFFFF